MPKFKKQIKIYRTEQWEYTAYLGTLSAIGSSEQSAELHLLRKVVFGNEKQEPKMEN